MSKSELPGRPGLSVCIIAKDAEAHIGKTIESVLPVADQVVVVIDDRTTDNTDEIAANAADRVLVVRRKWTHSFSDARNTALDLADGPWVMTMDADEDLNPADYDAIREALNSTPDNGGPDLYSCPLLVDPTYGTPSYVHPEFGACGIVFRDRIFWKPSGVRWRFRVHEGLIFPPKSSYDQFINARFFHRGRMNGEKSDYYTALLMLDHIDFPDEPVPAVMLAESAIGAGDTTRAAKILDAVDPDKIQGLHGSKFYLAKGKICQRAWIQGITSGGVAPKDAEKARDEAVACYLKGREMNRTEPDGAILAATVLFVGYDDLKKNQEAVRLLRDVMEKDPACIVAKRLLELWDTYGGPEGDRETFCRRLGEYMREMESIETDAHLRAEGRSEDPEIANAERLNDILCAGGRQGRGPKKTKAERYAEYQRKSAEGSAVALKVGE